MSRRPSNKIHVKASDFKVFAVCGEKFFTGGRGDWAYRLQYNSKRYWFCTWRCLREYEKQHPTKFEPHPDIIAKDEIRLKEKEKTMLKFTPCSIEDTVQSAETEVLKPCPFCGAELEYEEHVARAVKGRPILRLWAHPSGSCILAGMEVPLEDHPAWNRRERPSGRWEKRTVTDDPDDRYGIFRHRFYCTSCGEWQTYGRTRFCPCCGARMERE